jgi:hypothetical protein
VHVRPSCLPPPQLTDSWCTNWLSSDLVDLNNLCIWLSASDMNFTLQMNCNSCSLLHECQCTLNECTVTITRMAATCVIVSSRLIRPVHILTVCFYNMKFHIALVFEVVSLTRFLYKNFVSDFPFLIHTMHPAYCIHLDLIYLIIIF